MPQPDLIVVPGSQNPVPVLSDEVLIGWLRDGRPGLPVDRICLHRRRPLRRRGPARGQEDDNALGLPRQPASDGRRGGGDRVVWQGTHISGAGVSAGIDMALSLTERVHGRELAESLQLLIEYDPEPPFDSGSPEKAAAGTLRLAFRMLLGDRPFEMAAA